MYISPVLLRWCLTLLGTLLPCAVLWFLGPLLPQLEDPMPRLAGIGAALALWAVANLLLDWRRRGRDKALVEGVAGGAAGASAAEAAAVEGKLATALAQLSRSRGKRGYLYQQPWYAIIGPPGAGKTTALLNAGLRFPLAEEMGRGAVGGVGGTRHCDWWFTEDAVLIDTAGRYTTQDSDADVDRAGWDAFLGLLKRTRPRQPLNGVLVAFALDDVVRGAAEERLAHARAVRGRIEELETRLGVRMPVYALFTKVDLLAGFTEFFDDLDRERRGQVWGMTFPLLPAAAAAAASRGGGGSSGGGQGPAGAFGTEFRLLAERLGRRLFDRLHGEPAPDRRAAISAFPAQFANLEAPLSEFLAEAFGTAGRDSANASAGSKPSAGALPPSLLRGVYFTSATQEGTPFDRLTGAMARAFGLDQRRAPRLRPEEGRTYFLADLLRDVVFREAMLVAEPPAAVRRRRLVRAGAFALVLLLAAAGTGLLLRERARGEAEVETAATTLAAYEHAAEAMPLDPVADADLPALAPLLDQARALRDGAGAAAAAATTAAAAAGPSSTSPRPIIPLLAQDAKLAAGGEATYRHALDHALLPRLLWRLESQLRGNLNRPDFLYEATRIYLMLGGSGPLDRDLVREWMQLDWEVAYPGEALAPLRASLARHLDALLAEPMPPVPLDGELVAQARATFARVSLAQRAYSRIKPSAAAQRVPPWRPSDTLGAAGVRVFIRVSGRSLSDGIPGFLTVDGFHQVLLPALRHAAQDVASESWVLGQRVELEPNSPQMRAVEREIVALYVAEYIQAWDAMLADLDPAPLRSLVQAAQDLYVVASPQASPMRALLASIARQLGLAAAGAATAPPQQAAAASAAPPALAGSETRNRYQGLFIPAPSASGTAGGGASDWRPGQDVDDRYKALRAVMGADGGSGVGNAGAPIDQVLKPLTDLQQSLAKLAQSARGNPAPAPPAADDPAVALRVEAARQPQPLGRWLNAMATSGAALRSGDLRKQIVAAYAASGGPASLCPPVVSRYPFAPSAANEVPLDEFARLFGPGGAIDGFFNTYLRPYVDTSGGQWKPKEVDGVTPPVTQADLAQFQRAALIRDRFFAGGASAATPQLRFDVTPTGADAGTNQAVLDLGDVLVAYTRGAPARSTQVSWPGQAGGARMQQVRISWDPPPTREAATGVIQDTGPWALLRLFGRARPLPPPPSQQQGASTGGKTIFLFRSGERQAQFEIQPGGGPGPNAFTPALLQEFRCPSVQ